MSAGILFLVLPERDVGKIRNQLHEMVVPSGRGSVVILNDGSAASLSTDIGSRAAQDVVASISAYPPHKEHRLFVGHEVKCSIADLTYWWKTNAFGDPVVRKLKHQAMARALKEHLEATCRHWRVHAATEIKKFEGPPSNLDRWLQQFGELGHTGVGRKIAAKLRVIRTGELPGGAFATRPADLVGHRQVSCYVQDDDVGGSWLEMQGILTHARPLHTVHPVRWDKQAEKLQFPVVPVDEFVIYEDGLWSGSEMVRRLNAIAKAPPSAPVTFRFGVVTDFGLMVARHAVRSLSLSGRVSIDTSASELIQFLGPEVPERFALGLDVVPPRYFDELHAYVQPFAFSVGEDWTYDEIGTCKEIGTQLVRNWLLRGSAKLPPAKKVERFALGGGGFASTVVFSRSVPKVCLPLLWLDGQVVLAGKQVTWRPLFVDARRVSGSGLLDLAGHGALT